MNKFQEELESEIKALEVYAEKRQYAMQAKSRLKLALLINRAVDKCSIYCMVCGRGEPNTCQECEDE